MAWQTNEIASDVFVRTSRKKHWVFDAEEHRIPVFPGMKHIEDRAGIATHESGIRYTLSYYLKLYPTYADRVKDVIGNDAYLEVVQDLLDDGFDLEQRKIRRYLDYGNSGT